MATPGLLLDLVQNNALRLGQVQHLVLDEADACWIWVFPKNCKPCCNCCRSAARTCFSRPPSPGGGSAGGSLLRDPVRIEIAATEQTQPDIAQRAIVVDAPRRTQLLKHLIEQHQWSRVLVFVATNTPQITSQKKLYSRHLRIAASRRVQPGLRAQVLQEFKDERWQVVVTTDLAARGIDIAQLPAVVNYDLPALQPTTPTASAAPVVQGRVVWP